MKLWDIMSRDLFRQMYLEKYIRVNQKGNLRILNYTEAAQYGGVWNEVTRQCRGLVIDNNFNILARPFDKFLNYGQDPTDCELMDFRVQVTDKMDGSLGILFFEDHDPYHSPDYMSADPMRYAMAYGGTWHVATRGSFDSEQAEEMRKIMREKYSGLHLDSNWTYMFEIIYPENRVVLDYGKTRDLYLLAARNNHTGYVRSAEAVSDWPGPKTTTFSYETLREAVEALDRPNAEGYVIYFPDLDYRVKLKQDDYVALHKIVTGLTERRVWELMKDGKTLDDLIEIVPDEWHGWLMTTYNTIKIDFGYLKMRVQDDFDKIEYNVHHWFLDDTPEGLRAARKRFAEEVQTYPYQHYYGMYFALLDGKSIDDKIWEMVKPRTDK